MYGEMERFDIDTYVQRSRALDLSGIVWEDVPRHPLPPGAVRTLRYMQDIETHTIIYLRELLSTRAVDDQDIATFLPCWIYEETFHGRALARFLEAAGHAVAPRARSQASLAVRAEAMGIRLVSTLWPDFVAVHMTWGAINELATLVGYKRLSGLAGHPILSEILARIMRDESRHFAFYFHQARQLLAQRRVARVTRVLVEHFWDPVGAGVQPAEETRFLAEYLFTGTEGRTAARRVDDTIRSLPGFEGIRLLEAWMDRQVRAPQASAAAPASTPRQRFGCAEGLRSLACPTS
jgi:fatty acid desaturase